MNKSLQTVFHYHEATKHSQHRYARSLGYMDWATQPNPFREYGVSENILLPLALEHTTPPYHLLNSELPCAPLVKESLSQLFQFAMGIAAWKVAGGDAWAVRANASSGNLHPTESYLVLPPVLEEQRGKSTVFHYTPKNHALEKLAEFESSFWEELPDNSFIVGLSSITWREVWKYGERAFRYTNLDAGHAWQAFVISAKMLGWNLTRLDSVSDADIATLLGLSQKSRFYETELGDMLFIVSPKPLKNSHVIDRLIQDVPLVYNGVANRLSPSMQEWSIIPAIEEATSSLQIPQNKVARNTFLPTPTQESKVVVLGRRSIHVMDKESSWISQDQFHTILKSVHASLDGKENSAHLVLFVHRVKDYESGLYIFIRNERDKETLRQEMDATFLWMPTALDSLYLLVQKELRTTSKAISCSQDIASDGAFSLGMLCNFTEQLQTYGAHRYKELYWECGAIGQQLYLEATSMGLSGTGIGCFLDDMMHELLGLKTNRFEVLYHFTVGRGYVDSRIQTQPAYTKR